MSDLIKREEVIEALKLLTDEGDPYDEGYNLGLNTAILEVKKYIPTAEPKVGKWLDGERTGYNGIYYYRYCSECLFERNDDDADKDTPYCPNCGAKMERSE